MTMLSGIELLVQIQLLEHTHEITQIYKQELFIGHLVYVAT